MPAPIHRSIQEVWQHHQSALSAALDETIAGLNDLLRLDEHHRHGHEPDRLGRDLGPFAAASLDLGALSRVIAGKARSRLLPEPRLRRVQDLLQALNAVRHMYAAGPPQCPSISIEADERLIREQACAHLDRLATVFRSLRMARLEIRSKYRPEAHDAEFARFGWRDLGPAELRMCPPFLVVARLDGDDGALLRKACALLACGVPLKLALLRSGLRKMYPQCGDIGLPAVLSVETLPLALRGVHCLQTCAADPAFEPRVFAALTAPRPAVLSLLSPREGEDDGAFRDRATRAMRARAFPVFDYDPDRDRRFVCCFDLSGNPPDDPAAPYDLADFAAGQPEFAGALSDPPPGTPSGELVPLRAFLQLSRRQRVGKLPCVTVRDGAGAPCARVLAPELVTQALDQQHLWNLLQELAGIDNPHVAAGRETVRAELGAQQQSLVASLRRELEAKAAERERLAAASVVRTLVARFTGVDPGPVGGPAPHPPTTNPVPPG